MTANLPFLDRATAGQLLGESIAAEVSELHDPLALGLVRGGATVAKHLANAARIPWDVLIVRKIGAPGQQEFAAGAYAETGAMLINEQARRSLQIDDAYYELRKLRAMDECQRLHRELRGDAAMPVLTGRDIILTDDGMATGFSMRAAIAAANSANARRVIVAVPVLAPDTLAWLKQQQIAHVYLACPENFQAVGQFYRDFTPVTSNDVRVLLNSRSEETH